MVRIILIAAVFGSLTSTAQAQEDKRCSFNIGFGVARSWFEISGVNSESYPALELRLGGGIARTLGNKFQINSGLNICLRAKRESYMVNGVYYHGRGVPLSLLDGTSSKRAHVAFELPLCLTYSPRIARCNIYAGFIGRLWQPTNLEGDILKSNKEFGVVTGAERRMFPQWTAGLQLYFGMSRLFRGYVMGSTKYEVTNRFAQLTLKYTL